MSKSTAYYFDGEITSDGQLHLYENRFLKEYLNKYRGKKITARIDRMTGQRTLSQNNALWLGLTMLAQTLNDAGLDMRKVLKQSVSIDWNKDTVAEYLFKPIMKAKTGKTSTTELSKTGDIEDIWDILFRHLGEKHHVEYIPFPNNPDKIR